jgi:hypothetical protein
MAMISEHVARWTTLQREQYRLCDLLDHVAKGLPSKEEYMRVKALLALQTILDTAHTYEETLLFPVLEQMSPQISDLLRTFRDHHRSDREEALKIVPLIAAANVTFTADSEPSVRISLFASGLRRHIQFEEAICRALFASARSASEQVRHRLAS